MQKKSKPPGPVISNKLLAALPTRDYKRLSPHLEAVTLEFNAVLHEDGEAVRYVYFPGEGLVSLLVVTGNGAASEVGLVGSEGMVGLSALLGVGDAPGRELVQMSGAGVRVKAKLMRAEFKRGGALQDLLLRYTHALFTQISQSTACMASHALDRRLCRWLLMTHDGARGDTFEITQEFMASMLGVTRAVVTRAAGTLKRERMIRYSRGQVTMLDRRGVEARACECYASVREEYARVLG
jgi:CRP-like cAMP-binding protein